MNETTQAEASADTPPRDDVIRTSFEWCSWHQGNTEDVRLIYPHEQNSGPGGGAYACGPCRLKNGLAPFAEQP